ncbi:hypothetical protein ACIBQX_21560 [Nonomuraea sp. NPDC049714]|uniref:hypothetical protein n=1 Tax=Nonomuraea sp. NPDC049714 TaxID=3364357 RepID=UPI003796D006
MSVTALSWFYVRAYGNSYRFVQPLVPTLILLAILSGAPPNTPGAAQGAVLETLGYLSIFMIPVWAWAARQVLDTEPDTHRLVSATMVRSRAALLAGRLLAGYGVSLLFSVVVLLPPLWMTVQAGVDPRALLGGVVLLVVEPAVALVLAILTSRALVPSTGRSTLLFLGALLLAGRLDAVEEPRFGPPILSGAAAANEGLDALLAALPGITLRCLAWAAVGIAGYAFLRRHRE